ncbi:B-box zinc finger containing protein [Novymonas esmeraldas]|uniref:B-box zinc finger containing protein n=1 Tax=Novymonas esmeraldas TaxID=1808958 RepID=A0AAW0ERE2_9TRYP
MAASAPPRVYLRAVVYCDDSPRPHVLRDVRLPRRVDDVRRLVESSVRRRAQVLSFWNFARHRYEVLRDVRQLLQSEGRLREPQPHNSVASSAEVDGTATATDSGAASAGEQDTSRHGDEESRVYRCQLWMETVLFQLEPLDELRDRAEYDELCNHVTRWLGNTHVAFEVQEAVRIRCPYWTRMFDETRTTALAGNQDKVQLLYYSNNAWSVQDVMRCGFLLHNGVPPSTAAALQSHSGTTDTSHGTETLLSIPVPRAADASIGAEPTTPASPAAAAAAAPATANTQRTPFVFTSSMLSPHVRHLSSSTAPHKVLLCEVAPGRRFMTDHGLTGESSDKQAFPTPALRPPIGYDSVCYMRTKKGVYGGRTEDAGDVAVEDLLLVQVQVQHSHQALPRYLITVVPSAIPPSLHPRREPARSATNTPVRAPGTTAQAAAAHEDEVRVYRAAGLPAPPPPVPPPLPLPPSTPPSPAKPSNMKEWFKSLSTRRSHSADHRTSPMRSGVSDGGGVREVRYSTPTHTHTHTASPRPRAASATTPGHDSPGHRHVAWVDSSVDRRRAQDVRGAAPPSSGRAAPARANVGGVLYEGLHRGESSRDDGAAPPLVPSPAVPRNGGPWGRGSGGAEGTAPADLRRAPPRPPLPPAEATIDQFMCGVHPRQVQSLYCTACEELTCPYCASVGTHRDHVVVEVADRAAAVRAMAETLHEELRHWHTQYSKTESELRTEQARYAARQQRELLSLEQRFQALREALSVAQRTMAQTMREAQCRPPLAEAATVVAKYAQALAPVDAALRRYRAASAVQGRGTTATATAATAALPELLHFLRSTPPLVRQVQESFAQHRKEEERRLRDAVVEYEAQAHASEVLFDHVDWAGLRRLLEGIGSVRAGTMSAAGPSPAASSPYRYTAALTVPGAVHSRPGSATVRVRSGTPTALSSPRRDTGSDVSHQLLNSPPLRTRAHSSGGGMSPSVALPRSRSPPLRHERRLHRCLSDLQRGHLWSIQSATAYFAPGQRKAVCSTPFRLLGATWELRIAPLPRRGVRDGGVDDGGGGGGGGSPPTSPMIAPGIDAGVTSAEVARYTPPHALHASGDGSANGGQPSTSSPLVARAVQVSDEGFAREAEGGRVGSHTFVRLSDDGEEEWLGLFLFPLQHRMRLDFRVIAFSEVTWAEWHVLGWTAAFAGKGWGLHPFLQRRELMRTDKLARDNTVKICIAPISDLY